MPTSSTDIKALKGLQIPLYAFAVTQTTYDLIKYITTYGHILVASFKAFIKKERYVLK